jgi:hypothetical protein
VNSRSKESIFDASSSDLGATSIPELANFGNYPLEHLHADVASAVHGLDVDVIDLLDTFRVLDPEKLKMSTEDWTHPSYFANGLVVDQVVTCLKARSDTSGWFD